MARIRDIKKAFFLSPKICYLNREKTVHLTLFTMGEIFIIFLYFRIFVIFYKYIKNKIGILKNDIDIFPIVNSVILLFCKVRFAPVFIYLAK